MQSVEREIKNYNGDSKKYDDARNHSSSLEPGKSRLDEETTSMMNTFFVKSVEEIYANIIPPRIIPVNQSWSTT